LAYRIIKLELFAQSPGAVNQNSIVQVFRESQSSIVGTVDFTDTDLLAAGQLKEAAGVAYPVSSPVVFDNIGGNDSCNYYMELEEVPVTSATLMQLKLGVARKLSLQQD